MDEQAFYLSATLLAGGCSFAALIEDYISLCFGFAAISAVFASLAVFA